MTEDDFLRGIAAAPQDGMLRLVYADWLEERHDPRSHFLRRDAELVDRSTGAKFAPEKNLDLGLEWEAEAGRHNDVWIEAVALRCDLWLLKAPLRAKRMMLGRVRNSLGGDLRRARETLDTLPCRIVRNASLGEIFQWLDNTGMRRKSPDPSRPTFSALSKMTVKFQIQRSGPLP